MKNEWGCFRVVDLEKHLNGAFRREGHVYIPIRNILKIHRYEDSKQFAKGREAVVKEMFETESIYPLYRIIVSERGKEFYLVHPSEREHMERYLAGTDNPLYDLVNELRYNPNLAFGSEVRAAEQNFEFEIKKERNE